jgi:hypothetical protein
MIQLTGVSTKNISEVSQTVLSLLFRNEFPSFNIISLISSSNRFGLGGTYLKINFKFTKLIKVSSNFQLTILFDD